VIDYTKKFKLEDKNAVVTGGAGLIGKEVVAALAQSGAHVVIADTDKKSGKKLEKKLQDRGLEAEYYFFDMSDIKNLKKKMDLLAKHLVRLDIWVNTAYPKTKDWGLRLEKIPYKSWQRNVDIQLNSYTLSTKYAAEIMKEQKSGTVINFGSTYGLVGPDFSVYKGTKMTMPAAYSAIKGGIINFTRYMASYYGKHNIRVNCVSPGGVYNKQPRAFVKNYAKNLPLGRMASASEMAPAVVYLASEASQYVTGHNLVVDGGWTVV